MGPAKILKIGPQIKFLWPSLILNRDVSLTREVSDDHENGSLFNFFS